MQAFRRLRGLTKDKNETKDRKRPPRMTGETKEIFDRLTEDAMKLLDNGDYSKNPNPFVHQTGTSAM